MENSQEDNGKSNVDVNWFKKHSDTITIIVAMFTIFIWIDTKFDTKFEKINDRLIALEKDMSGIKIILSMKGMECNKLAKEEK